MDPLNTERMLERFLRYVRIDTTANETAAAYPSSRGQLELGKLLVRELREMGVADAAQDRHGLVLATIPATSPGGAPTVALNAHLDTSPEASGADVQPQVVRDYQGGDLTLPGNPEAVIRQAENPELQQLVGCTLVTSDGTTLLGGDDKAGVAVIMETAAYLAQHPELPHGPVRILFTCDEEIGRGVQYVDLDALHADACYTLDGKGADEIDVETFSADLAVLTARGVNIHPSIARDRMVNAVKAAAEIITRLPRDQSPETTDGRDGFLHPYQVQGGVAEVRVKILLRDFQTAALTQQAEMLRQTARDVEAAMPGATVQIDITPQYRNLGEGLAQDPRPVQYAQEAHRRLGRVAALTCVRGGTDGAQLTARGLPTPNLSTGQHNPHSTLEWVCLEEMVQAAEVVIQLVQVWARS